MRWDGVGWGGAGRAAPAAAAAPAGCPAILKHTNALGVVFPRAFQLYDLLLEFSIRFL